MSKVAKYLKNKYGSEDITLEALNSVSDYRKAEIREKLSDPESNDSGYRTSTNIKRAQVSSGGGGFRGTGDSVNQVPNVYSPLWLDSNLSLPRDHATINAWLRSFYALNPFVHNAINLHSTYPISKLNIKCKNKKIENFFNDMAEELDLINKCVQIAKEYWLLGEAFPFMELDENKLKWSSIKILNPDYMIVKRTLIEDQPLIMMKPDENLKRIVTSNKSSDIEQRKQLNPYIVNCVLKGQNIPLDNFQVSFLARQISPYESRGTGLPVCVFKQLALFDKIKECFDSSTEVLTSEGFKHINDILGESSDLDRTNAVGVFSNGNLLKLKQNIKVACFNKETESVEYHTPNDMMLKEYSGEMYEFKSKEIDLLVTPGHQMLVQKGNKLNGIRGYNDWEKVSAKNINAKTHHRFRSIANFDGVKQETINILGKEINTDLYLKFLGYLLSEGYISKNKKTLTITQSTNSDCIDDIKNTLKEFGLALGKNVSERTVEIKQGNFKTKPADRWNGSIHSKELCLFLSEEISNSSSTKSKHKKVPSYIKSLHKDHLEILLNSLVLGDGSNLTNKNSKSFRYYTVSQQLANDVQEIVFKCGYSPNLYKRKLKSGNIEYTISWSDNVIGNFPSIKPNMVKKVNYNGLVWCFDVPTGYLVVRRNGKVSVQGNCKFAQADSMINPVTVVKVGNDNYKPTPEALESWRQLFEAAQYNKDFKIFTNEAVDIQAVGRNSGILDTSGDFTQLIKEILIGLQVPSVLMDGGSDTTYANGGVALDVLRQRYMQFRNMLASWLKRKVFAPISKMNEFYEYEDGQEVLIVPEVDWNHMSLFDAGDYIQNLVQLTAGEGEAKRVAVQELHRSLGLDYSDQIRKIKKENIANAILKKEQIALEAMTLNELRALTEEDEIEEKEGAAGESKLPGEGGSELPGMGGGLGAPPDLGAPGPSSEPPAPV